MRYTNRKVTEDPVVERILDLLKEQGKTEKSLLQYLGLANGTFILWKYENGNSFLKYIVPMSEYLEVTPNYLLRGVDDEINVETLSTGEIELIKNYRSITKEQKECVRQAVNLFAETVKGKKC